MTKSISLRSLPALEKLLKFINVVLILNLIFFVGVLSMELLANVLLPQNFWTFLASHSKDARTLELAEWARANQLYFVLGFAGLAIETFLKIIVVRRAGALVHVTRESGLRTLEAGSLLKSLSKIFFALFLFSMAVDVIGTFWSFSDPPGFLFGSARSTIDHMIDLVDVVIPEIRGVTALALGILSRILAETVEEQALTV